MTINAVVANSKASKINNVKYGKALNEIASSHLKNQS
jgi:hypothetical protein